MQLNRLNKPGSIDFTKPVNFQFDGKHLTGFDGDTAASALLANDIHCVGRSLKTHRPRGILSAGLEEPGALLGQKTRTGHYTPNLKATEILLRPGMELFSQNCWPSPRFDLWGLLQGFSSMLTAGFYYKTFMWPSQGWHKFYESIIRRFAGQGKVSSVENKPLADHRYLSCDCLIVGSGPAGLSAALTAIKSVSCVVLMEQDIIPGGSTLWRQEPIDDQSTNEWRNRAIVTLRSSGRCQFMCRTLVFGQYDHGQMLAVEQSDKVDGSIFWKVRAKSIVFATGAFENPMLFAGNDKPGVMLAGSFCQYIHRYSVSPGRNVFLAINNSTDREQVIATCNSVGISIAGVLEEGQNIKSVKGRTRVSAVTVQQSNGRSKTVRCDLICMSNGWNPAIQLMIQNGGHANWSNEANALLATSIEPEQKSTGACRGLSSVKDCIDDGQYQVKSLFGALDSESEIKPFNSVRWKSSIDQMATVDIQNEVMIKDIDQAYDEGYQSVELVKRYTTLGMGTDQGKTSWPNALQHLSQISGQAMSDLRHTTFRPAYSPVAFSALVGPSTNENMIPTRQTPFHRAFERAGCVFQTSGAWLYSRYFPIGQETMAVAIAREVEAVRNHCGCVDMSTLGKIDVKGQDAAEFLSRVFVNRIECLAIGRVRYVLMLREDGVLFDDGTVSRLDDEHYLVTLTTANSAAGWRWMNRLLQLHWTDLDVQITSVSDHWASLAIAGPHSRSVLQALNPEFDTTIEGFPSGSVRQGNLDSKVPCRVFSISFSGELSFEINVPARFAEILFDKVIELGETYGITPYGLETLDILRIEKGHLSIGTEIDGRTTAGDLGLGKMAKQQKPFIGKTLMNRPALNDGLRRQLVSLVPADTNESIPLAALLCDQPWDKNISQKAIGQITAAIQSPSLGHSMAIAMLEAGRSKYEQTVWAVSPLERRSVLVIVGPSCLFDPKGERMRG
jgi:glycine cleavage system aminomethyltransferase T/NADPH-dependent 2,4-dienoyl-CoA reductase/sulfur reductase-like enzyme